MVVEFRVLGAVEMDADGRQVEVGPPRRRCVLAALLVDAGRSVPVEHLVDRVWGERPPPSARATLASHITRLRQLPGCGCLSRRSGGYVLDTEDVDLHRFRRLVARARTADDEPAAALLGEAVGLWRGEAFAGLDTEWINVVRVGLAAERQAAERDLTDVGLRLGRHTELLAGLRAQVDDDPSDERLAGQLMLALYRSGRQAEALTAFQRLRTLLVDQLGVEPGAAVRDLHTSILTNDRALVPQAEETIRLQRKLIEKTDELADARGQLAESMRAEQRSSQLVLVLQTVLTRLSTMVTQLTEERGALLAKATTQLAQARRERRRAEALADAAQRRILVLEQRLQPLDGTSPFGELVPVLSGPTPDEVLTDAGTGLDRVQQLLDEQDERLTEIETHQLRDDKVWDIWQNGAFRELFFDLKIGVGIMGLDGAIMDANRTLQDLLGRDLREMRAAGLDRYVATEHLPQWRELQLDVWRESRNNLGRYIRFVRADGETVRTKFMLSKVSDDNGAPRYQLAVVYPMLRLTATEDPLTGLPGRATLMRRLKQTTACRVGLCYLNLDDFKLVNDRIGHHLGDQVLAEVGRRLTELDTFVARVGGGEFMLLVEDAKAEDIAERAVRALRRPMVIGDHELTVTASVGVVERPLATTTVNELLRVADIALRLAKTSGKDRWVTTATVTDAND
ncbi:BTAD domain-containing putative transcriptional regulator [Lentzea sp. NPDC051213]|uniref:BTAD domain-containing putative transcriptional regulator n=1 Tax=Lentzea sp. NPDC051213 TaxID=3364126 RepID=UPI0037A05EEF